MKDNMQVFSLCDWVVSLNITYYKSIHFPGIFVTSFFLQSWITFCFMYVPDFIICPSTDGQLDWFQSPAIVSRTAVNVEVQISLSLGKCPEVKYHGHMIVLFLISWGASNTDPHSGYASLHSQQQQVLFLSILCSISWSPLWSHPIQGKAYWVSKS